MSREHRFGGNWTSRKLAILYQARSEKSLFGEEERVVKAKVDVIGQFFVERLKSVFAGVSETPAILSNSKGSPLYLFCFAAANPKGAPIALRIADHLLKVGR